MKYIYDRGSKGSKLARVIALLIIMVLMTWSLAACGNSKVDDTGDDTGEATVDTGDATDETTDDQNTSDESAIETTAATSEGEIPEGFTERDFSIEYSGYSTITLSGSGTSTDAKSGVAITNDGGTTVVEITKEGSYLLSGTLDNGQIVIDVDSNNDKVQLVLDGVDITNEDSAAIYVKSADKVFVTTTSGSDNKVTTSGTFVQSDDNNVDGAIFSKDDIVFNGGGTLTVNSQEGHGIVSKNDLKITSGNYSITSAKKALQGKDLVGIAGGDIVLDAGSDGIASVNVSIYDGTINIIAGDDGINVKENDEGATPVVALKGGTLNIVSEDDGIQTTGDIDAEGVSLNIVSGGGSANAATHYGDMAFGQMGGWGGMGQGGPQFGGEQSNSSEINYDTDDDESINDSARNKGIKAANITLVNSNLVIDAQDDAINVDGEAIVEGGNYDITAGDDGIHADYRILINGGTLSVQGWEGLEATIIQVNDGDLSVGAEDDGFNAAQKVSGESPLVEINGGNITIDMAQGDTDALDSNGDLYINGGIINLNCQSPFDYDGTGAINGGTVYVYGEEVTEMYNQFGGGMGGGPGGMGGGPGGMGGHGGGPWG